MSDLLQGLLTVSNGLKGLLKYLRITRNKLAGYHSEKMTFAIGNTSGIFNIKIIRRKLFSLVRHNHQTPEQSYLQLIAIRLNEFLLVEINSSVRSPYPRGTRVPGSAFYVL